MSLLHFVSGKGGTGKSTLAASLAQALSEKNEGPVLLLEVQGSGRSLEMLGLNKPQFENTPIPTQKNIWGARILPRETFRQYFGLLLAMGKEKSAWATATSGIRDRVVDLVFENKVVSAFIETCPGLEPAVLLGKLHWEATRGHTPEMNQRWAHVVVDAPSTGHGVMLFKSAFALTEVFSSGIISRQANEIMTFVKSFESCRVYLATTAEELPLSETRELAKSFAAIQVPIYSVLFNRVRSIEKSSSDQQAKLSSDWQREYTFEKEAAEDEKENIREFCSSLDSSVVKLSVPELYVASPKDMIPQISSLMKGIL